MAKKSTLNTKNLESLGARRLAELLVEATSHDAAAKRRLKLEIAAAKGPKEAASEIRKRLSAVSRSKTFVPRSRAATLADVLETQREAVQAYVAKDAPSVALDVLWRFMGLADRVFDRCDDSYGLVGDVFRSARSDLGRAAAAARPDPVRLAGQIFDALWRNGFGQYDGLIGELAPALGEQGLEHLRQRVLAFRDDRGSVDPDEAESNVVTGPWGRVDDDEVSVSLKHAIPQALSDIADAQGDVDAYIAQHDERERRIPVFATKIARRLLAADRAEEAWQFLEGAECRERGSWGPPDADWEDTRIDVLEALGRVDEAQAARWSVFEVSLEAEYVRAYLERLPDSEKAVATARALDLAVGNPDVHRALLFVLEWPDLPRAADLVVCRARELNGDGYDLLNLAAASLAADHPLAATLALRAMIGFTLSKPRPTRYRHAARNLLACAGLSPQISDYRGLDDHDAYAAALLEAHGRKTKFWALVGDLLGTAAGPGAR